MIGFNYNYNFNNELAMPSLKLSDYNEDDDNKKRVTCKIDTFDEQLYKIWLKNRSSKNDIIWEGKLQKPLYKFFEREFNETRSYEDISVKYNHWVLLSTREVFETGRSKNKKKLNKIYNKQKPKFKTKKNRQITIVDDLLTKFPTNIETFYYGKLLNYNPMNENIKPKQHGFNPVSNLRKPYDEFNSNIPLVVRKYY